MTRIPVTNSELSTTESQTPWHWLTQGWHSLRDRAMDSLTYFSPHESDGSQIEPDSHVQTNNGDQRWGIVAIDLTNGAMSVDVDLEIPGMEKSDLAIDVVDDYLLVSGQKHFSSLRQQKDVLVTERAFGRFQRRMPLPCAVDIAEATASYENGVLRVCLPKLTANKVDVSINTH